jgi:hypothetical protein
VSFALKTSIVVWLALSALTAAQGSQTFTGTISDAMCPNADHRSMRMGSTDAECTDACVSAHGAEYVLYDGKQAYELRSRQPLTAFAGKKVRVVGTRDPKTQTIQVSSISAAK